MAKALWVPQASPRGLRMGSPRMLQSDVLPGTSTPRSMQEDGTSFAMTETNPTRSRVRSPRGLVARWRGLRAAAAIVVACIALGGCVGEQFQKGYILPPGALEQIPIGASQDQVLIVMGTPATVATLHGDIGPGTPLPHAAVQPHERPLAGPVSRLCGPAPSRCSPEPGPTPRSR